MELIFKDNFWIRTGTFGKQDLNVISEVYNNDGYYTRLRGDGGEGLIVVDIGALYRDWETSIFCSEVIAVKC